MSEESAGRDTQLTPVGDGIDLRGQGAVDGALAGDLEKADALLIVEIAGNFDLALDPIPFFRAFSSGQHEPQIPQSDRCMMNLSWSANRVVIAGVFGHPYFLEPVFFLIVIVNCASEDFIMASKYKAGQVVDRLRKVVMEDGLIFIAAVGSGISAKWSERGGADIIATYSIAKYRMMGFSRVSYLPIGDANVITENLGKNEILPIVRECPVIAGVFAPNPTLDLAVLLDEYSRLGFSGVMNCPTVALLDGWYRKSLEDMGLGFDKEVELTRLAVKRDLFVQPFVTSSDEAERMVEAGAHMIIAHLSGTVPVDDQITREKLIDEAAKECAPIIETVKKMKKEVFVAVHGGPIAFPDDVRELKARLPALEGFLGGSSAERLPVEGPIREAVAEFKSIKA